MIHTNLKKQTEIIGQNIGALIVLAYIFFSVIPHASAPRYILSGLMLLAAVYQLCKGQLQKPSLDIVTGTLLVLFGIVVVSAAASPYRDDSLSMLHKDTLQFLLGYLLLTCQKLSGSDRQQLARYTFVTLIAGFIVKMSLAIWAGANNGWNFSIYEGTGQLPRYLDFFAADIIYYLPFLLAPLLFWPMRYGYRLLLAAVAIVTLSFAFIAGVRTTFIFVCVAILFFVLCRFWSRKWYFVALVALFLGAGYFSRDYVTNPSIARYYSIFSLDTYNKFGNDGSISERKAIAKGVWEIAQDRLWLGYGPGWKKLPTVASEGGYIDHWKNGSEPWHQWAVNYFSLGAGRVNPHNFYLMVLFETGALGLAAYLAFMLAIGFKSLLGSLSRNISKDARGICLAVLVYIGTYLGAGLAGGPWLPVTLLVAASSVVLCRQPSRLGE